MAVGYWANFQDLNHVIWKLVNLAGWQLWNLETGMLAIGQLGNLKNLAFLKLGKLVALQICN